MRHPLNGPRLRGGDEGNRMTDQSIDQIMRLAPVIPVIVIDRVEDAVPMAEALVAGGLPVLEVTLRTPAALDALTAMKAVNTGAGHGVGAERASEIARDRSSR